MTGFDVFIAVLLAKITFKILELMFEPISLKEVNIVSISKKELEDLLRKMEEEDDQ